MGLWGRLRAARDNDAIPFDMFDLTGGADFPAWPEDPPVNRLEIADRARAG